MKYHDVVYGNYPKSNYPLKLAKHLLFKYMESYWKGIPRILDIGCGDGTYVRLFEDLGMHSYGLNNNVYYSGHKKITLDKRIDLEHNKLPFKDETFDIVFNKSVIEHVKDTDHFLEEIYRVLKPGGLLLILTPAWEHNYKDFYNDYTHVKPFHRKGLQDALKINNFTGVNVEYFYHIPWLWDKDYLLPAAHLLGRLGSAFKWKDREETIHRPNIRFLQEVQLLGRAIKTETFDCT